MGTNHTGDTNFGEAQFNPKGIVRTHLYNNTYTQIVSSELPVVCIAHIPKVEVLFQHFKTINKLSTDDGMSETGTIHTIYSKAYALNVLMR